MVAFVNTELMALCDPEDSEHAELVAVYLEKVILSQAGIWISGAGF